MLSLSFDSEALEVQRRVVIEEFKEVCLNQPYGDTWHHLMDLTYKAHPYKWPTIGKEIKHIEEVTMEDIKSFFYGHYRPNNAILVVSGNASLSQVKALSEKWFGEIPKGAANKRALEIELPQSAFQFKEVSADVPLDVLYMAFHIPNRNHPNYYKIDLLSDVLSNGASSRLFRRLLKEQQIFTDIDCYITGSLEPGLFLIEGKPAKGVSMEAAENAIWNELEMLKQELSPADELEKLKNKIESLLAFSEASIMTKAMNLAFFELMEDANRINGEAERYQAVTVEDIQLMAQEIFRKENCSELRYLAKKKKKGKGKKKKKQQI